MEDKAVKSLVNKIFAMKGMPKVTKFAAEFSDGGKLQKFIVLTRFYALISSFPSPIQHSIRGEHQLQVIDFDSRRRQNSKLEPDQCPNLLQLLAARVLPC